MHNKSERQINEIDIERLTRESGTIFLTVISFILGGICFFYRLYFVLNQWAMELLHRKSNNAVNISMDFPRIMNEGSGGLISFFLFDDSISL